MGSRIAFALVLIVLAATIATLCELVGTRIIGRRVRRWRVAREKARASTCQRALSHVRPYRPADDRPRGALPRPAGAPVRQLRACDPWLASGESTSLDDDLNSSLPRFITTAADKE